MSQDEPQSSSSARSSSTNAQTPAADGDRQGKEAAGRGDYQTALRLLQQARHEQGNNLDVLNMLAYVQRKLGQTDEALESYRKALKLRPQFPEAREYLGEVYIQASLEQIDILSNYGNAEAEQHKKLVEAFRAAAAQLHE